MYTDRFGHVFEGDEFKFNSSGKVIKIVKIVNESMKIVEWCYNNGNKGYDRSIVEFWVEDLIHITNGEYKVKKLLDRIDNGKKG